MDTNFDSNALLGRIDDALAANPDVNQAGQVVMERIQAALPYYKWVGIYWLDGATLRLGPYVGAATDHMEIQVGVGVCGTAVAEDKNQVIGDVRELGNYLACSLETRSEIVVLIRDDSGRVLGQIDADGHGVNDFDARDEAFLQAVARRIAVRL